ncbi:MAG: hypothetical protein ACKVQW_06195 [Pyrinomonadaceae bacterium]
MTANALTGAHLKVARARYHIQNLQAAIQGFANTNPYKYAVRDEPETGKRIYYLADDVVIHEAIHLVAGDVIQNTRNALDHLAYGLVLIANPSGIPGSKERQIAFPVAENATKYISSRGRITSLVTPAAIKTIDAIEPYGGGKGSILWQLHALSNIDKHRLPLVVAGQFAAADLGTHIKGMMIDAFPDLTEGLAGMDLTCFFEAANKTCPLKAGDPLLSDLIDNKVNEEMKFKIEIALYEPQIIDAQPIGPALERFVNAVDRVVRQFDALV